MTDFAYGVLNWLNVGSEYAVKSASGAYRKTVKSSRRRHDERLKLAAKEDPLPYSEPPGLLLEYVWRPLPSSTSIRILVLDPGHDSDPLTCSLSEVDLESLIRFNAVSYCCGNLSDRRIVACEGRAVSITKNLYEALLRIRSPDTEQRLWADALCIDQSNMPERAQQIQLMGRVYRQAGQCLVWLGTHTQDDALAFKLLETIASYRQNSYSKEEDARRKKGPVVKKHDGKELVSGKMFAEYSSTPEQWRALSGFFARPWFRRVWTLQEVVLPIDALMICGKFSIDANTFFEIVEFLHGTELVPSKIGLHGGYLQSLKIAALRMRFKQHGENIDLFTALRAARDRDATDKRDKVLGVVGLSQFKVGRDVVAPDYRRSVQQIYCEVAREILLTSDSPFRLFRACLTPASDGEGVRDLPGWVPDWSRRIADAPCIQLYEQSDLYLAGGKIEPEIEVPEFQDGLPPLQNGIYPLIVKGKIVSSLNRFVDRYSDALREAFEAEHQPKKSRREKFADWYFHIAIGWVFEMMDENTKDRPEMTIEQFFLASCWSITQRTCTVQTFWEAMTCTLTSGTRDEALKFNAQQLRKYAKSYHEHDVKNPAQMAFLHNLEVWTRERKFCVTDRAGEIGWVPLEARRGDFVCVFQGSQLPYVLRRGSERASYSLIGHCFFHGIMFGEKAEDVTIPWEDIVLQ